MNKSQLVEKVSQKTQLTKQHSECVLDAAIEIIQRAVSKGEDVKLVGFGTFCRIQRRQRKGINPQTGAELTIPGTKVPRFRPGKEFKKVVK